jgi:hypothetical protein
MPAECLQNAFKMPIKMPAKVAVLAFAQIVIILFVASPKEVKISIASVDVEFIFHSKILQLKISLYRCKKFCCLGSSY